MPLATHWTSMTRLIAMSSSSRTTAVTAILMVSLMTLTSACGNREEPPPPSEPSISSALPAPLFPNWPPEANNFRFHWTAAPGIDLETGPAVALRAYVESYRLAGFAGGDPSAVYPGFIRATSENVGVPGKPDPLFQLTHVRPKTRAELEANGWTYTERLFAGYQPTHVLSLEPQGDRYWATVCLGLYSVYRSVDNDPNTYVSTMADPDTGQPLYIAQGKARAGGVEIWRVELTDKNSQSAYLPPISTAQHGPLPAPVDKVFGPWFITGMSSGLWGTVDKPDDINPPQVRQQCQDAMPDDLAAREAMATGFHDSPPPHREPIPGWPNTTN